MGIPGNNQGFGFIQRVRERVEDISIVQDNEGHCNNVIMIKDIGVIHIEGEGGGRGRGRGRR